MRIVLLGGGIAHISFVRNFANKLPSTAEVVLVHQEPQVFYEPSFCAVLNKTLPVHDGFVDLRNLCTLMGVTFIQAEVSDIQLDNKIVRLKGRAALQYDTLSLNGLEVAQGRTVQIQNQNLVCARDYSYFFSKLKELHDVLVKKRPSKFTIAVVGGGGNGVQVAQKCVSLFRSIVQDLRVEIFEKKPQLLEGYPNSIRKHVETELRDKDILFYTEFDALVAPNLSIVENKTNGRTFSADFIIYATGFVMPDWIEGMDFVRTSDHFLETHKNGFLISAPDISASGWIVSGSEKEESAMSYAESLFLRTTTQNSKTIPDLPSVKNTLESYICDDELLSVQWGVLRKSQKQLAEKIRSMKSSLEHLRALKEQKQTQSAPHYEDQGLIENLKRRLQLDINQQDIESLFSSSITNSCRFNSWIEKEYKDVFNDHFQSSFYVVLDLLEKSYLQQAQPQYLKLHVAAPKDMKDVEILSQIIIGCVKAIGKTLPLRIHICGSSMNTVQMTLGVFAEEQIRYFPNGRAYLAVARPLGLYGLLSQQAKSDSVGKWMSAAREQLNNTLSSLLDIPHHLKEKFSAFSITEWGMINDLVNYVGHDGWRVCVNLSQLPRWEGVDHIMKQNPSDSLLERNWTKGFKYWPGNDKTLPESQYLLWEPHVLRASACFVIDPSIAMDLDKEFLEKHNISLEFIGYVETINSREQTHYKLSDWELEESVASDFVSVSL